MKFNFLLVALMSKKGTSSVFFAITLFAVLGFTALTIDVGTIAAEKWKLSSAVDSAVLAGAQELIANSTNTKSIVEDYISKNAGQTKEISVVIDSINRTVEAKGVKSINNSFAKILGIYTEDITSTAKAKIENIRSISGTRPLAVIQQTFIYGKQYTLKEGAGDGINGNYAAIALGGTGGSTYRDNLLIGYGGTISVGNLIQTETGNISGTTQTSISQLISRCTHTPTCTYQSYNRSCPRIIFIPIVDTLDVNGRKYVKVLGFGTFFLDGVVNHGGQADVIGRFITYSMQGETSNEIGDFGTYGISLVK